MTTSDETILAPLLGTLETIIGVIAVSLIVLRLIDAVDDVMDKRR